MNRRPPKSTLFPSTTLFRSARIAAVDLPPSVARRLCAHTAGIPRYLLELLRETPPARWSDWQTRLPVPSRVQQRIRDRKSTRLNSSHAQYLVCRLLLEKKKL